MRGKTIMELAGITAYKISEMFVIIVMGAVGSKTGIITQDGKRRLSDVLLLIVSPVLIFTSYQKEFDRMHLNGLLQALVLALISHVIGIVIAYAGIRGKKKDYSIERFSMIFSNCGFMGIPLIQAIYGSDGVFYVIAYITVFNLLAWTLGVVMMTGRMNLRTAARSIISPATIAIAVGVVCYGGRMILPNVILEPMTMVADMNTPIAMLIAGASLAEGSLGEMFGKPGNYYVTFLRLLVAPFLLIPVIAVLDFQPMVENAMLIASACPTAAMTISFALKYDKDELLASELFGMTTLLCAVTIPVLVMSWGLLGR